MSEPAAQHIDVITIFPEYMAPLDLSLVQRARTKGLLTTTVHNLRDWTTDVHHAVDDSPFGGGPGMVMKPSVWGDALEHVNKSASCTPTVIFPTPAGEPFTHELATELAGEPHLVFACGRYEGIDQRVVEHAAESMNVRQISIGDFVLIGGEVAALAMIESVTRLRPGVLGNARSAQEDSFADGILEAPCYTRPEVWNDRSVPPVLLSGHHGKIAAWRREEGLRRTAMIRPELLTAATLDDADRKFLTSIGFDLATGAFTS